MKSEIEKRVTHTAGEWTVSDSSIVCGDICIAVIEDDGGYEAPAEQQAANARLIASAPELLEACKGAFEMMDFYAGKPFPPRWAETMHEIKSAIAKATAGSPPEIPSNNADQVRLNKGV